MQSLAQNNLLDNVVIRSGNIIGSPVKPLGAVAREMVRNMTGKMLSSLLCLLQGAGGCREGRLEEGGMGLFGASGVTQAKQSFHARQPVVQQRGSWIPIIPSAVLGLFGSSTITDIKPGEDRSRKPESGPRGMRSGGKRRKPKKAGSLWQGNIPYQNLGNNGFAMK